MHKNLFVLVTHHTSSGVQEDSLHAINSTTQHSITLSTVGDTIIDVFLTEMFEFAEKFIIIVI